MQYLVGDSKKIIKIPTLKREEPEFFSESTGNDGGERGIRTLDTIADILVFETSAFNHSAISPRKTSPKAHIGPSSRAWISKRLRKKQLMPVVDDKRHQPLVYGENFLSLV